MKGIWELLLAIDIPADELDAAGVDQKHSDSMNFYLILMMKARHTNYDDERNVRSSDNDCVNYDVNDDYGCGLTDLICK
jgi:hypothetical protein